MNNMIISDIEFILIFILPLILFIKGLKKKTKTEALFCLDKSMSIGLKGISCILILIAHFYNMYHWNDNQNISWLHFSKICGNFSANIAVVIFMFISGYGLSKSHDNSESFISFLKKRIWKVYYPLLIVCIISIIIYLILPNIFSINELKGYRLSSIIYKCHYISCYLKEIILFILGYLDWYVLCIIIFYLLFWLSKKFAPLKKSRYKNSILLLFLLISYYTLTYNFLNKDLAHYYRFPWAFFAGHFIANYNIYSSKEKNQIGIIFCLFTFISFYNENLIQIISWLIAISILILVFTINRKYSLEGKFIQTLGNISYYVYLTHARISFVFILFIGLNSLALATLITIIISFIIFKISNKLS